MHKKRKYNGHNVHKYRRFQYPWMGKYYADLMYVVCPERGEVIGWLEPGPNPETGENNGLLGRLTEQRLPIVKRQLGRHGYLQSVLAMLAGKCKERWVLMFEHSTTPDRLKLFNVNKEEKKMGEIKKDRITLDESEGCYLELFSGSNTILFHFGTESREVVVPDDYEIEWGVEEMGTCDLRVKKKKPKLLNMKFTVKARPIFRHRYVRSYTSDGILNKDLSAMGHLEEYEGESIRLVIIDGVISSLLSDDELLKLFGYAVYTVDDIPLIENKIREAYNIRKIFPNATNGIDIIREEA